MRAFTPILTARQMRRCDAYTIRETGVPSHILMERAAALVRGIDSRPAVRACDSGRRPGLYARGAGSPSPGQHRRAGCGVRHRT